MMTCSYTIVNHGAPGLQPAVSATSGHRMPFDNFRKSLKDLMSRATPPDDRREIARRMRETLVQAKVGLAEMPESRDKARARLAREERQLETVRRRRQRAVGIDEAEQEVAAAYILAA